METVAVETPEHAADVLLRAAYSSGMIDHFEAAGGWAGDEATRLGLAKVGADLLVAARLARFADEGRTQITVTNAGRYWALHGGYFAFLKEEPLATGGGGRQRNPELEAMRMTFMKLRLNTFWWTFGFSLAGFCISVISLVIAFYYGRDLLMR